MEPIERASCISAVIGKERGRHEWATGSIFPSTFCCSDVEHCESKVQHVCVSVFYLLVYLLCGLSITEGNSSQVFQDGHLHGTVAPIEQRHQGAGMHWPVHDLGPNTWRQMEKGIKIILWFSQFGFVNSQFPLKCKKLCLTMQTVWFHFLRFWYFCDTKGLEKEKHCSLK